MTDPFSFVVGMTGLLSCGVTLCHGLSTFYSDYRSADGELNRLCRQLETTKATMLQLQDLLERIQPNRVEILTACMDSAQEGIRDLEAFWKRAQAGIRSRSKLRRKIQKALFSPQKDTMKELQATLHSLLSDVGLAVQILN